MSSNISMGEACIVVPVFNEYEEIDRMLTDIDRVMQEYDFISECIVIDDNSDDGTSEIIRRHNVKCLKNDYRCGYGASIKRGVDNASTDLICIIDGDNTYCSDDIPRLYEAMGEYDVVIGARPQQEFPFCQRIGKYIVRLYLKIAFKLSVDDINSGLLLLKKNIIKKYENILSAGFSFSAGIILASLLGGYKVGFVPIKYKSRKSKSKIKIMSYVITFIKSYGKIIWNQSHVGLGLKRRHARRRQP